MSSYFDDETNEAIEATRERRRQVAEQGRQQPTRERTSTPSPTPKERAGEQPADEGEGEQP